jgi:hypothetical protein
MAVRAASSAAAVQSWQVVRAAAALLAASAAVAAVGFASGGSPLGTATAVCPVTSFTVAFDPKRQVVVASGGRLLARASFERRILGRACRRVRQPKAFRDGGLGREIRRALGFRCAASAPIRVHVNPIRDGDHPGRFVGSALVVGIGDPFRTIVSAVLKNRGDPKASRLYRAAAYCKLGA